MLFNQTDDLQKYLQPTKYINSDNNDIAAIVQKFKKDTDEITLIRRLYEYVRDEIKHTCDIHASGVSRTALDVLKNGHGVCYAQAHLLAALLRNAGIPAGICYQELCLDDPEEENPNLRIVLHAVNTAYIASLGKWIRMDARGNKPGVNAHFMVEGEQLAFKVHSEYGEKDGFYNYYETPDVITQYLERCQTADELEANFPSHLTDNNSIMFTCKRPDVIMEIGKGMYLWDTNGKKYLDFVAGWAVNCLGHSPKAIQDALCQQASKLVNCSPSFYNSKMLEFAGLLSKNSCFDKVFFATSGAEANESAIKLARKYGSKVLGGAYEIITTTNGFHGRTLATMSATGKSYWEPLFAPKVPGFIHVPFNDAAAVKNAITDKTCAVMLEPIQGEGGVNVADYDYIKELRRLCDEKGILLIFDEVQTGMGRTGKLFAYEHYDVQPDIMTLAKGIGSGFPLSAMLTKEKYNIFEPGDQGGTYSSQPLAMSVGIAVLEELQKQNLCENANEMGEYLKQKLNEISSDFHLNNIRGMGLLIAFDVQKDNAAEIVSKCMDKGLLINSPKPASIRLMPALIVSKQEIDEMIEILCSVLAEY